MRIIVAKDYDEMSEKAARMAASQLVLKPDSVLGLATGGTPVGFYRELIKLYNEKIFDFKHVKSFNLDEYLGLSKSNEQSYYYYMMENLFKHVNIEIDNVHVPNGMAENIEEECKNYENMINAAGGIDIQILGIGKNGHIGFNEPDVKFEAETHLVCLDEETIEANSRFFNSIEEVPTKALSMGIKTIMHARKIILLASGEEKAEVIREAVHGGITPDVPASILQLHPDVTFILDGEAGSKLPQSDITG